MDAFVQDTQQFVNGQVTVELYKGNCMVAARDSKHALYDYALSTYDSQDTFDHEVGRAFTLISALPDRIASRVRGNQEALKRRSS